MLRGAGCVVNGALLKDKVKRSSRSEGVTLPPLCHHHHQLPVLSSFCSEALC